MPQAVLLLYAVKTSVINLSTSEKAYFSGKQNIDLFSICNIFQITIQASQIKYVVCNLLFYKIGHIVCVCNKCVYKCAHMLVWKPVLSSTLMSERDVHASTPM